MVLLLKPSQPLNATRKSETAQLEYAQDRKRPKYCLNLERMLDKDNEPERIVDKDLLDMLVMIKEVNTNPSLIFQRFNLPWTANHLAEQPSPNCVMDVQTTKVELLYASLYREASRSSEKSSEWLKS